MSRKKSDIKRPFAPAYVSKTTLAYRLDMSMPIVDRLINKKVIPEPVSIDGIDRWRWEDVDAALAETNLSGLNADEDDPISQGIQNAQEAENGRAACRRA